MKLLISFADGLLTAVLIYQPIVTDRNAQIAHMEVEILRAEMTANQATDILRHERLMHFGIASGDVEKIMREKASADARKQLGK